MKKRIYIVLVMFAALAVVFNGCKQSELEELYPNPSQSSTATVENFFTGLLRSANEMVLPWYWRFFVVEQPTLGHYTQTLGWFNGNDQYIPPTAAIDWRWNNYYTGPLTHFRVMTGLYEDLDETAQAEYRIFMLAAKVFFYDQTQQLVDLYGDIPWSEAGMVRELGDLDAALPKYDDAKDIYTTMIADLKAIAEELHSIQVPSFYQGLFTQKDYLNDGIVSKWEKYANSLRLRMLVRASGAMDVTAGVTEILTQPGQFPVVSSNDENIMLIKSGDLQATTASGTGGIRSAMETWGTYDIAPKAVCDNMKTNNDPRLVIMFDPNINGEYNGMDPLMNSTQQNQLLSDGLIARYDTATFTRNNLFPGWVIGAAEVSFMKAEAAFKAGMNTEAKAAYNLGISQSIDFWYNVNATGTYRDPLPRPTGEEILAYLNGPNVSWDANADKMKLIATQKWLDTGMGYMTQTWCELRRLNNPQLDFMPDNNSASGQTLPPMRWLYPTAEQALNADNYSAVSTKDKLNTKIFWDVD